MLEQQKKLESLVKELRQEVGEVDNPQAKALLETSSEVLLGLKKAFVHLRKAEEEAFAAHNATPEQAPDLRVQLLSRQPYDLRAELERGCSRLIVFFGGYKESSSKLLLRGLQAAQQRFNANGVRVLAVSADSRSQACRCRDEWGLQDLAIGYGLSEAQATSWGLDHPCSLTLFYAEKDHLEKLGSRLEQAQERLLAG